MNNTISSCLWMCKVYPFHHQQHQQYGHAWCAPFTTNNTSSIKMQGVSISTASSMEMQGGVSLSTNVSMDVQGVSLSTANRTLRKKKIRFSHM
jgi:hypothetical protein